MDKLAHGLRYEPIQSTVLSQSTKAFPIDVLLNKSNNNLALALSDYQLMYFSLETMTPIWSVPNSHRKKITSLCQIDEKTIASASSDSSVKLWDTQSGKLIQTLKNQNLDDFFSVASSQHILAAGSEGLIRFFDLKTMKLRSTFDESQNDEISALKFNPKIPTELLSSSLDGLLIVYDLTQENEEESLTNMIRFEEPLNSCDYLNESICYSVSTSFAISMIDIKLGEKLKEVKTITHDEFNEDYLIDTAVYKGVFNYFIGNKDDNKQIKQYSMDKQQTNLLISEQQEQIRQIKYLDQYDSFLVFGEDGVLEVLKSKEINVTSIEQEAQESFNDKETLQKGFKKFGKK